MTLLVLSTLIALLALAIAVVPAIILLRQAARTEAVLAAVSTISPARTGVGRSRAA